MNIDNRQIRKAAILVASLDQAAADAILDQLSPEDARRVRESVVDLEEIDPKEQRQVLDEFSRVGRRMRQGPAGVELDGPLARRLGVRRAATALGPSVESDSSAFSSTTETRRFGFLRDAEGEKLARILQGERPQTIALVLSHLSPEKAGSVLVRLPSDLQLIVVRRLVDLEETDPEILAEVERALEARLSQQVHMQRRRVAGIQAVVGILQASGDRVAEQILDGIADRDQPLAERLGSPPPMEFDDLARLDDSALAVVFRAAEPEIAMTALVGAAPELIDRILRRFASPEVEVVRHKLDHPGPIRLSDVEAARREIAELARRLTRQGKIRLGNPVVQAIV